jgi:1,4-dihydroxy-6-naphthoate synthase
VEVTAASAASYPHLARAYQPLASGASVGDGYGPVLVVREGAAGRLGHRPRIGVPGLGTTARLLLRLWRREVEEVELAFDAIPGAVLRGDVEAGVLIHEGQLTYHEMGLEAVVDLGRWWWEETGFPVPLGLVLVKRDLPAWVREGVSRAVRCSVELGLEAREEALDHALAYARGLQRERAGRFVAMYVNRETVDLSPRAREGLSLLYVRGHRAGLLPPPPPLDFV